jgi:hypothetical protein
MRLWVVIPLAFLLLTAPAKAAEPPPPPDAAAQQAILDGIRKTAQRYQDQLPDFVCTLLTKRFEDRGGTGKHYKQRDSDEVEFRSVGRVPHRQVLKVNNKPARKEAPDGFRSDALLPVVGFLPDWLLGPDAKTRFQWVRWDSQAGERVGVFRPVAVFRLDERPSDSRLQLRNNFGAATVGLHGFLYADPAASTVLRLELQLEIPRDGLMDAFESSFDLDYGSVFIAGQEFFLPVRTVAQMRTVAGTLARNETQVVRYQKYAADSSVTFGDSDR